MSRIDLPEDTWRYPRAGDPAVGDLCAALPLPAITPGPYLLQVPELDQVHFLSVMLGYGLVVREYSGSAVYIPVVTGELFEDPGRLHALAEHGRDALDVIRLPPLKGAWEHAVAAYLCVPQSIDARYLTDRTIASMEARAAAVLTRRFKRAVAGGS